MSEFEKKLQQQQFKKIPGEWRAEILRARALPAPKTQNFWAALNDQITALLWPHPKAWAGIAAVWVLIFAANLVTDEAQPRLAQRIQTPSAEYWRALREQEQFLTQLIEPKLPLPAAEPPKHFAPRPRSEYHCNFATA